MNKTEIILELNRLKDKAIANIKKTDCYIEKFYGCDYCINENGSCELNSEAECLFRHSMSLKSSSMLYFKEEV